MFVWGGELPLSYSLELVGGGRDGDRTGTRARVREPNPKYSVNRWKPPDMGPFETTSPLTPDNRLTFVDVFAGAGGLSLGLMNAGLRGLFAVEREKNAFETLSANLLQTSNRRPKFDWPA